MRYSHFAILSTLSILAVLAATTAAHAFSPADLHQGPETAAVPVPDVEKVPLPAPEGMQEAASAPPQQVFTPETPVITAPPPNQDSADQQEAQSRQNKVLTAALQAKEQEQRPVKTVSAKDSVKPAASLAAIEPAAGGKEFVSVSATVNSPSPAPESAKLSHVNEFVDKIMAYHLPEGTKVKAPAVASQVTLEDLLSGAGVALNSFVPAETVATGVVSQWASGKISGLYERVAGNDDFNSQVINYIGRYRQNCGTGLTVHVSPAKTSKAGTTATVDIECAVPSNSYAVSFLFLEDDNGFGTILHTAALTEKERLRGIRDAIAQNLNGSQGFAAPQAIGQSASRAPLKLNVPASGAAAMDDLATIIIQ